MICGIAGRRPAVAAGSAVRAVVCRPCRWRRCAAGDVLSGAIVASYRARLRSVGGVGIVFLGGGLYGRHDRAQKWNADGLYVRKQAELAAIV